MDNKSYSLTWEIFSTEYKCYQGAWANIEGSMQVLPALLGKHCGKNATATGAHGGILKAQCSCYRCAWGNFEGAMQLVLLHMGKHF